MGNRSLRNAKMAKNDDYYTLLSDIEDELQYYCSYGTNHFEGKSVLCNCDNPEFSNFWVYFHKNFKKLGLKRLTAIHYSISESAFVKVYTGGSDEDISCGTVRYLDGDGDFRSEECKEILEGADIVVTNPPFSLFREFISQLIEYNKEFAIIGSISVGSGKFLFPYIHDNEVWFGATSGSKSYILPDDSPMVGKPQSYYQDGQWYQKLGNTCWITNIDIPRRHEWLNLSKEYSSGVYYTYENYDAINVDKLTDIPVDYFECYIVPIMYRDNLEGYTAYSMPDFLTAVKDKTLVTDKVVIEYKNELLVPVINGNIDKLSSLGTLEGVRYRTGVMGVPVTFLGKHNPDQFEIIGCPNAGVLPEGWEGMSEDFLSLYHSQGGTGKFEFYNRSACYIDSDGKAIVPYTRILICRSLYL